MPPQAKVQGKGKKDECDELRQASLKCLYSNPDEKEKCQGFFDNYKQCKKDLHERTIAERRKRTSFW